MNFVVYNSISMPIEICNIITSYANCIEQVYNNHLYYKYNDQLIECHNNITLGIINNTIYTFTACDDTIEISQYNSDYIYTINFDDSIYALKYSNNLVVDHMNEIAIYSISIDTNVSFVQLYKIPTNGYLLYADSQYIITTSEHMYGFIIYNTELKPIHHVLNNGMRIYTIAIVNDILSYNMLDDVWHEIANC